MSFTHRLLSYTFVSATIVSAMLACPTAVAQIAAVEPTDEFGVRYGDETVVRYRVGAEITARRGACRNITAMVAVPLECPEQSVTVLDEDFSGHIDRVRYRHLNGDGARQMLISLRHLPAGAVAKAAVTFEVRTRVILPPETTAGLTIPQRLDREFRRFTNGSPYIEVRQARIRRAARDAWEELPEDTTDWQRVETIYDQVLETVRYVEGPDKSAVDALRDGFADCQGRSALFIALCRANDIPARMVWVDGHAYPEFYLLHSEDEGNWYPCESSGSRAFGEMPLARVILQKGDKFRVPERSSEWLRYASDYLVGVPVRGGGPPRVRYIRELVQ